jgi:hypothetical protein
VSATVWNGGVILNLGVSVWMGFSVKGMVSTSVRCGTLCGLAMCKSSGFA